MKAEARRQKLEAGYLIHHKCLLTSAFEWVQPSPSMAKIIVWNPVVAFWWMRDRPCFF
ncbi:hypothetical protein [Microcoleus sp. F4-D5]|uniref:hypothetical protein n=1 Tax=Microcoleus sp. F4-D5 TaxID=2818760 RepID=UPI002FCEE7B5